MGNYACKCSDNEEGYYKQHKQRRYVPPHSIKENKQKKIGQKQIVDGKALFVSLNNNNFEDIGQSINNNIQNGQTTNISEQIDCQKDKTQKEKEIKKLKIISDILCNEKNFEIINLNGGKGNFGDVIFVKDKSDNQYYAVKTQNIYDSDLLAIDNQRLQSCINEAQYLREFQHKNVVKVFDDFQINNYHFMKMELCEGSLQQWVEQNKNKQLTKAQFMHHTNQLLDGIEYVHKLNYVLRDLSLNNILICRDGTIKLCDFGLAKKFNPQLANQMLVTNNFKGALLYYPPEILNNIQNKSYIYNQKGDIWALGICLQLLGGLEFQNTYLMTKSISNAPNLDQVCNKLIQFILIEDPQQRPTIPMIRSYIYKNINDF